MKQIIAIALAAFLGSVVAAVAAQQTDGIVEQVDVAAGTLLLQSGQTFKFKNGNLLEGLLPGQLVGVSHEGDMGIDAYNPHPATCRDADSDCKDTGGD